MFEFFRSRDKSVRYLLTALLAMVALSMITYLIPGGPGGGAANNPGEQKVAEVCGETITTREVMAGIQNATRNKQFPPEMIQNYIPELINQMITERALACQSGKMGFKITDEDLAENIRTMLPNLFQGGQTNTADYERFLSQNGLTVPEFETNVRKQMLLTRLRNVTLEGVIVTPQEVEAEYRRRKESAKVDYFAFNEDKFRAQVNVSAEEVQSYFGKNRVLFKQPERRSFDLLVLDQDKVAATYQVSDADLQNAYSSQKERFRNPERLRIRHILLKTTDKKPEEVTKIEAKMKDLLKQVKGGADFGDLAKKNSEDPGSAIKGGELDWVTRGQTVKNFESTAFALKPNELSDVIKTEYGFHILQLLEKQDARLRPFDEVKAQLMDERKKNGVVEKLQASADQLRTALTKTPADAAQLAQKFGASYYQVKDAAPGDPLQEIGLNKEMGDAVTALQKGGVTSVVPAPGNKLAMAVLTGITATRPSELAEAEGQIRGQLIGDKARQLAQDKSKELQNQIASAGGDLKKLAAMVGAEVKTTPDFQRDGAVEGVGSATYLADAFTKPIGTIIGPVTVMGQTVVAKVAGQSPADLGQLGSEREGIVQALKSRKARSRQDLFEDGLVSELTRQGKVKIDKDMITRIRKDFRS